MATVTRVLVPVLLLLASSSAAADDRFHARFSHDLRTVEAELCFDGPAPDRLYRSSRAAAYASPIRFEGVILQTPERSGRLRLPSLPADACLTWSVDLGAAADEGDYRTAFRAGDSIHGRTTLWFWKGPWRRPLVARVTLPQGHALSTPWPRDPADTTRYRPVRTPSGWSSRSAIGPFEERVLPVPGGTLHIALLGDLAPSQRDTLTRWIETSAAAVTPVLGRFPSERVQVVIVPIGPRSEPVPWAHVIRGGGPSIQFYVDETRSLAEFDADWTATHEFSHLLLPYVSRTDRWLSEGLASYYQNVLRARDGRLSEQQAWQKLHEGFRRGQRATGDDTLAEATRAGWRSTMRVYWSGAAMMLQADTLLRERSGGGESLDTALGRFLACCQEEGRLWKAQEVLRRLDQLTGTNVFMSVFEDNVNSRRFPDVDDTYEALGLEWRQGRIRLLEGAPLVAVRREIMGGPSDTPTARGSASAP